MASKRIAGITIELNGDVQGLNKALKGVDTQLRTTKTNLKDVEKLLELDPGNVELLEQKQKLLNDAVKVTTERLDTLKDALTNDLPPDQYDALQREIIATQQELEAYQGQLEEANGSQGDLADGAGEAAGEVGNLASETSDAAEETEEANSGWSTAKQVLADLVTKGIDLAVQGLKDLGQAFKTAVTESAGFADEILTLSIQSGLSTDTLQEFAYAAELIDVDLDTVVGSMTKLEKQMVSARDGSSSAQEAFDKLGVSYQDSEGNLRNVEDVFYDMIEALGEVQNETELDAAAMDIFGKSAKDLKPLIKIGKDGLNEFKQEAHDMGAVLDTEALEALGDVDDGMQRLDQSSQVLQRQLAVALAPAVTTLLEELVKLTQDEKWQTVFAEVGETIENLLPVISSVSDILGPIFDALSPILDVVSTLMETLAPLIATLLQPISEILLVLIDPISQLITALLPGLSAMVEALVPILTPIGEILQVIIDLLMPLIDSVMPLVTESMTGLGEVIGSTLTPALEGFAQLISGDITGAFETWGDGINDMWSVAEKYATKVKPLFKDMFTALGGYFSDWGSKIKTGFSEALDGAKSLISKGLEAIKSLLSGDISLPHIALPHFSVSGSFSLNPPSVPRFSIDWYAKAMKEGMILDNPTIFGAMNGKFLGGGESGAEAVVGVNSLMGMIQQAVNSSGTTNLGGVTIVVNAAEGQSVNAIADAVAKRINAQYLRKVAVQQ